MALFWERGYEGTSFDALTAAMGVNPSTFYNSFGSKELLYRDATNHYMAMASEWFISSLANAPTAEVGFSRLIEATAEQFTRGDLPAGCMISLAGTHLSPALGSIRRTISAHRAFAEEALLARLKRGVDDGDVASDTDIETLAAYFNALLRGMAVQARDGASRERILNIGRIGLRAWPATEAVINAPTVSRRRSSRSHQPLRGR